MVRVLGTIGICSSNFCRAPGQLLLQLELLCSSQPSRKCMCCGWFQTAPEPEERSVRPCATVSSCCNHSVHMLYWEHRLNMEGQILARIFESGLLRQQHLAYCPSFKLQILRIFCLHVAVNFLHPLLVCTALFWHKVKHVLQVAEGISFLQKLDGWDTMSEPCHLMWITSTVTRWNGN